MDTDLTAPARTGILTELRDDLRHRLEQLDEGLITRDDARIWSLDRLIQMDRDGVIEALRVLLAGLDLEVG